MRTVSVVLILVVAAIASAAPASEKPHYDVSNAKALFEGFIKKHDSNCTNDATKDARYQVLVKTLELMNMANNASDILDSNQDADDITEEDIVWLGRIIGKVLALLLVA